MKLILQTTMLVATLANAADVPPTWLRSCSHCHGRNGHGETAMGARAARIPHFDTADWQTHVTDDRIREVIRNGVPDTMMRPLHQAPTEAEVEQLVKYLRTLGPPAVAPPTAPDGLTPPQPQETLTVRIRTSGANSPCASR